MTQLAVFVHHRARLVLAVTAVCTLIAGPVGAGVIGSLSSGGYSDPSSPSSVAARTLARATGLAPAPSVVVMLRTRGPVTSPQGRAALARVAAAVGSQPQTRHVISPLGPRDPALLSRDGSEAYVQGFFGLEVSDKSAAAAVGRIARELRGVPGVTIGGSAVTSKQFDDSLSSELPRIELVAFSVLLLLSLVAFRGLVAAALPLMVGAVAVAGTLLIMRALAQVTTLSVYSLNLVTGLGLGLALDYSLFIVYRYREELARRGAGVDALAATLKSAGRTVAFSSTTVTLALLSLLVFPQHVLSSMGIAAACVTAFAAVAALVPLGAVLALLGDRVNALAPARLQRHRHAAEHPTDRGRWYRLARWVMRHAAAVALACSALLLVLGLPALRVNLGALDSRALPAGSSGRVVDEALASRFAVDETNPIVVLANAPPGAGPALASYARGLARLPGAAAVRAPHPLAANLWRIDVLGRHPPLTRASQSLVAGIRATPSPYATVTAGRAATQFDQHASIRSNLALALIILGSTTLIVLFLMTGSVVLPVKSLIMNVLTLSATFGVLVLVFQDGHLESLLGFAHSGFLEQTNMVILFIIAFGLSTDYGVFLLSRIKELHDAGAPDREAVALGLESSGPVVSAAAVLFCAAIGALVTSRIVFLKEFGVGAALAVLIDATIVRALLVPALMALLGGANWWAPGPLRRLARSRLLVAPSQDSVPHPPADY
jgi:uncharacterized membrane protein YdfJ with MMPL/SSD domain